MLIVLRKNKPNICRTFSTKYIGGEKNIIIFIVDFFLLGYIYLLHMNTMESDELGHNSGPLAKLHEQHELWYYCTIHDARNAPTK